MKDLQQALYRQEVIYTNPFFFANRHRRWMRRSFRDNSDKMNSRSYQNSCLLKPIVFSCLRCQRRFRNLNTDTLLTSPTRSRSVQNCHQIMPARGRRSGRAGRSAISVRWEASCFPCRCRHNENKPHVKHSAKLVREPLVRVHPVSSLLIDFSSLSLFAAF
jgi:hypothetical protein